MFLEKSRHATKLPLCHWKLTETLVFQGCLYFSFNVSELFAFHLDYLFRLFDSWESIDDILEQHLEVLGQVLADVLSDVSVNLQRI